MPGNMIALSICRSGGARWTLGKLSPLIWTRADTGITVGTTGTVPVDLSTWGATGITVGGAGPTYTLTADAGVGVHEIAVAATTVVAGYEELTFLWTPGTAPWFYIRCGATGASAWFSAAGTLGTGGGTGYVTHMITPMGGGVFLCSLRCVHVAANTERIGVSDADNTTSWGAAGTETATVGVWRGFDLGAPAAATIEIQQRILDWVDSRNPAIKWTQVTAANQFLRGRDARGWFAELVGAQYMVPGDASVMAALTGDVPTTIVLTATDVAVDAVRGLITLGGAGSRAMQTICRTGPTRVTLDRIDDGAESDVLTHATASPTDLVVVHRYSGTQVLGRVNSTTYAPAAHSGACTLDRVLLGSYTTGTFFGKCRLREVALCARGVSDDEANRSADTQLAKWDI